MFSALFLALYVFATRPAQQTDGRMLSVREAVGSSVRPAIHKYHWNDKGELVKGDAPKWEYEGKLPEGEAPGIVYGQCVSRNEFGGEQWVIPCPTDKNRILVYRKDERRVSEFPLLDITTRTGSLNSIRYPMNGMASELISLCVCDTRGHVLNTLQTTDFTEERYLTNPCWSPDGKYIFVQVLDREQHNLHLNQYRADNGRFVRTILTESNDAWVEPLDPLYFVRGSYDFIYRTDNRDGYRNLYLCDTLGHVRRITNCDADVEYKGNDGKYVYYITYEISPAQSQLKRIRLYGNGNNDGPERLTSERGWHKVLFNRECTKFIDIFSNIETPGVVTIKRNDGHLIELVEKAGNPLEGYAQCEVEIGTVKSADGKYDNWYRLIKPLNFDPHKKYPVIHYVYGGPHSQMVNYSWLANIRMWEMLMAQKGYIVYIQDNRGTLNQGADYEKAINRQCGQAEMADQIAGLKNLLLNEWADNERVGIHGWSYGGFMTISLMTNYPEIYKVGVSGGPVIDWKWYETMYGERYMDTPQTNPEGFEATSLMNRTSQLKGKLLICQGAIDDTVLWQHSLNFVQKCIMEGVQLDYFPYPCDKHNMQGEARVHLHEKITQYFTDNL